MKKLYLLNLKEALDGLKSKEFTSVELTNSCIQRIKEVDDTNDQDGICKIITPRYPKNIALLYKKYQIKPQDGLIKKLYKAHLDSNILFDFNM